MKRIFIAFAFLMGLFASPSLVVEPVSTGAEGAKIASSSSFIKGVSVSDVLSGEVDLAAVRLSLVSSAVAHHSDAEWRAYLRSKRAKKNRKYKHSAKRSKYKKRIKRASKRKSLRRSKVVAKIDISSQRMRVYQNGKLKYSWKVSTGKHGHRTPTGNYRPQRMYKEYYSKKYYNSPMPYAVFFRGGYAIHGTGAISRLGRPASHGCVRLHTANAAKLYSMIRRNGNNASIQIVQ